MPKRKPMFTRAQINGSSPKKPIGKVGLDFAKAFRQSCEDALFGNPTEAQVSLICTAVNFIVALEDRNIIILPPELNELINGITRSVRRWETEKVFRFYGENIQMLKAFIDFFEEVVPTISERDYRKNCNLVEATLYVKKDI